MQDRSRNSSRNRKPTRVVNGPPIRDVDVPPPKKRSEEIYRRDEGTNIRHESSNERVHSPKKADKKTIDAGTIGTSSVQGRIREGNERDITDRSRSKSPKREHSPDNEKVDNADVEIDFDRHDDDPARGAPVAYHYRNQLFTRDAIRARVRHHADRYKHYPPMLQKQFQSDLAGVFNEEYPFIRDNIRPIYSAGRSRNHYATQRSKKGEKRPPNCYTLFCNDVKASFSASYIQRKGIHNLWRQLSDRRKQQYKNKAKLGEQREVEGNSEEDQEARWNSDQYVGGPKLPASGSAIKLYGTDPKNETPPSSDTEMTSSSDDDESVPSDVSPLIIPPKRRYDSDSSSSDSSSDSD